MANKKKTRSELEAENRLLKQHGLSTNLSKIIIEIIRYGAIVACFYFLQQMVHDLAGKQTAAKINVDIMTEVFAVAFGIGGIAYGRRQRKLRRDKTEYLQNRIQSLEKLVDPKRSSSRLTPRGETRPEDL